MIIKIKKKRISEWFPAILLLIPYLDRGWIRNTFLYKTDDIYIYPIEIVLLFLCVIFLFLDKGVKVERNFLQIRTAFLMFLCVIFLLGLVKGIINNKIIVFLSQYIWIILPILFSLLLMLYITKKKLDLGVVIDHYILLFAFYCLFSLVIQILFYGYKMGSSTRIGGGSGSGGLLFSYTIAMVFGLLIIRKEFIPKSKYIVYVAIFLMYVVLGGSRAAITIIMIEFLISLFINKSDYRKLATIFILILCFLIWNPSDWLLMLVPRLNSFADVSRGKTVIGLLEIMSKSDFGTILTGYGIGQFFPYQKWLGSSSALFGTQYFDNFFVFDGHSILVQPHNTFLYIYVETGILGLVLLLNIFVKLYKNCLLCNINQIKIMLILLLCFGGVFCCVDSVLTMNPGVSSIWWSIFMFIAGYGRYRNMISNAEIN